MFVLLIEQRQYLIITKYPSLMFKGKDQKPCVKYKNNVNELQIICIKRSPITGFDEYQST